MNQLFIGREKEQQQLKEYLNSEQSEFIAIYGRRRVGKTFLIQKVIGSDYAFYVAGMNKVSMRIQLKNFMQGIQKKQPEVPVAKTWLDAFVALENYLETLPEGRKIVFIDEMPWMDSPRSNFISGLEHFWNSWASWRDDIKLIVCGSATSWIINNLIKNRGGLHNRVTHKIPVKPFTLRECQLYFDAKGFRLSTKQIAECYMVLGGVPFYLSKMNKGESVAQNIDRLIFAEDGELHDEFQSLYDSLYKNAANHIKIVTALATKGQGLTRKEIVGKTNLADNGKFSLMLEELESCGFIRSYEPFLMETGKDVGRNSADRKSSDTLYQLVDSFTLFYFQVLKKAGAHDSHYWSNNQNSHVYSTWSGLSFEMLCLNHAEQIKNALGISGITANVFSWYGKGSLRSAQIDMLIDRADRTINICEMKFWNRPYAMSAKDEADIERKVSTFIETTNTDKNVIVTMITTKGIEQNEHSGCVQREITLDELFC
ncbi:MAG: AAA family ATPase [Bacteroidales bacterium]|nr:AAA family ATPase [Bacteroidales bacterium]MBP5213929.1 AAA family ATPase [Bacteroidales bacterium]MBP5764364.1 AAA family ATPase [Bacteroidales bacterium]